MQPAIVSRKRSAKWIKEADQIVIQSTKFLEDPSWRTMETSMQQMSSRPKDSVVGIPITCHEKSPSFYKVPQLPPPMRCPASNRAHWKQIGEKVIRPLNMQFHREATSIHSNVSYVLDYDSVQAHRMSTAVFTCTEAQNWPAEITDEVCKNIQYW